MGAGLDASDGHGADGEDAVAVIMVVRGHIALGHELQAVVRHLHVPAVEHLRSEVLPGMIVCRVTGILLQDPVVEDFIPTTWLILATVELRFVRPESGEVDMR